MSAAPETSGQSQALTPRQVLILGGGITGLVIVNLWLLAAVGPRLAPARPVAAAPVAGAPGAPAAGAPAAAKEPAAGGRLAVIKVPALGVDDPLAPIWDQAPVHTVQLAAQQMAMPSLQAATIERLSVRAATDGTRIAFRISWKDATPDWNVDTGRFCDAVAIGFPLDEGAPPMMGAAKLRMQIIYWKALWQRDVDQGFQDVQDLHPNFWSDLYWFAQGGHPHRVPGAFQDPRSHAWFPAKAAGNPMTTFARTTPVQELVAEGWGSLTHQDDSVSTGRGIHVDGRWEVVISRPLQSDDPLDYVFQGQAGKVAFAAWDGASAQRGARKQWSSWVEFQVQEELTWKQPTIEATRVPSLGKDDPEAPLWANVPSVGVPVQPQQMAMPSLDRRSIGAVRAQAAVDGERVALRITWNDDTPDWSVDTGRFCDAVAIGFPLREGAPPMMGAAGTPLQIIYWKALWQGDVDKGYQDVQDLHPNFWSDLYWFAEGSFPYRLPGAFKDPRSRQWFPAHVAGNPMASFERQEPVEELVAEGWGSLTHQPRSASSGRGLHRDGRWVVVISRPLVTDDPLDYQFKPARPGQVVFAVWNGSAGNRGARKHWSNWVPFQLEVKP